MDDFNIRDNSIKESEREFEKALRPLVFDDFQGQQN